MFYYIYVNSYDDNLNEFINILCLYGKKYIMLCKIMKSIPSRKEFVAYMLMQLQILIEINCKNRTMYRYIFEFFSSFVPTFMYSFIIGNPLLHDNVCKILYCYIFIFHDYIVYCCTEQGVTVPHH